VLGVGDGLIEELGSALVGRVVVVGVGDARRGDDGVGPLVVRLLAEAGVENVIDAGVSPEIETWRIRELAPDSVLFVDAVDLNIPPGIDTWRDEDDAVDLGRTAGDVALLRPGDLRAEGFDTHRAPLRLTMEYIEAEIGAGCRLLAVQPRDVRQGARMCPEVAGSAEQLVSLITEAREERKGERSL